jgi:pimeloyl-ACP methyl ester carboxylesterase
MKLLFSQIDRRASVIQKNFFCIVVLILLCPVLVGQRTVQFYSEDSVEITASLYFKNIDYPFIVLTHGLSSSRGEFNFIATKLTNLDYNCIAVDLRVGDESNYVHNETVKNLGHACKQNIDALKDVRAAIDYAYSKNNKAVILFGNTLSASLCLLAAKQNKKVKAVIGFTPGEYFKGRKVRHSLVAFDKQVFIGCSLHEKPYVDDLTSSIPESLVFKSCHPAPLGVTGIDLLTEKNPDDGPFWLDLLFYFNRLSM